MTTTVQPSPGDFGLTKITGLGGYFIRAGQWMLGDGFQNFEHAFIFLGDDQLIEAEPGGARVVSLSEIYTGFDIDWSTGKIPLTDEQRQLIVSNARALEGTPYSFLDYFALAAHRLRLPVPFLKRYIESSKHLMCSQLVDMCYMLSGVHLYDDGRWPGYVTPGDLYELLASK